MADGDAGRKALIDGQRGVDADCGQSRNRCRLWGAMHAVFIPDREALSDASELMRTYGEDAAAEAAARAARSRDEGNVMRFCHWRQIERVIATLSTEDVLGTIH